MIASEDASKVGADVPLAYSVGFQSSAACPLQATEECGEIAPASPQNAYVADAEMEHSSAAGGDVAEASREKDSLDAHPVPLAAVASAERKPRLGVAEDSPWDR